MLNLFNFTVRKSKHADNQAESKTQRHKKAKSKKRVQRVARRIQRNSKK